MKAAVLAAPAVSYQFGPGSLKDVKVPIQLWRASNDEQAPDAWNTAVIRQELSHAPEEHVVTGAGHYVFLPPCGEALARQVPSICIDQPSFDRQAFHRGLNKEVVAFFQRVLHSPRSFCRNLVPADSMRAKRDYDMLAMLFGCGCRRSELVGLELDEIQVRQGHWAVVDLIGKGGHIRTVPIRNWVKAALDQWTRAATITDGKVFRAVARKAIRTCAEVLSEDAAGSGF